MSFQCTFAGEWMVYPTEELKSWIEKNISLKDFQITLPPRTFPGAATDITYQLQTPNTHCVELYKLHYPSSGVNNWAEMFGIVSGKNLAAMQTAQMGDLIFSTSDTETITFNKMIFAFSIPLVEVGHRNGPEYSGRIDIVSNEDETLHLACFVDERFFIANYKESSEADLGCQHDWYNYIDALLTDCGLSPIIPDISSDYGVPSSFSDLTETNSYQASVLLEAALVNCGLQLIRSIDGTYEIKTLFDSITTEQNDVHPDHLLKAGGDWARNGRSSYNSIIPRDVVFYYPIWSETKNDWDGKGDVRGKHIRSPLNSGDWYNYSVSMTTSFVELPDLVEPTGYNTYSGAKVFRMSAQCFGSPPRNLDLIEKLSKAVARDFYIRQYFALRMEVWNGFVQPSDSGFYTYIYNYLENTTKIVGDYINHDYEQMCHELCGSSSLESSSSYYESSSSSSLCYNPFRDLPIMTNPEYVLGMDVNQCLGWVRVEGCDSSSSLSSVLPS